MLARILPRSGPRGAEPALRPGPVFTAFERRRHGTGVLKTSINLALPLD